MAAAAQVSPDVVSRLERGQVTGMPIATIEAVFVALGASVQLHVSWRGGGLDRLLDERHSALAGAVVERLRGDGWEVEVEVSYAVYGERGSIDVLGWHLGSTTLLVVEIKTELTSIEETLRRHDAKVRLARGIAAERFGWEARSIGRLLVLPDGTTARRQVDRHGPTLGAVLPTRGAAVREWLRHPNGRLAGVLFLPFPHGVRVKHAATTSNRVRRVGQAPGGNSPSTDRSRPALEDDRIRTRTRLTCA